MNTKPRPAPSPAGSFIRLRAHQERRLQVHAERRATYERREKVIDAFFDLADAIITVRSLIRQADHPPLGHPTGPTTMINTSIRATS